jgi:hypothetical protein
MELAVLGLDPDQHIAILPCAITSLLCGLIPIICAYRTKSPVLPPVASSETIAYAFRGHRVKKAFLALLGICNFMRSMFYFLQYGIGYGLVEQVLYLVPSILFFSAFSAILKLWSELATRRGNETERDGMFGVALVAVNTMVYAVVAILVIATATDELGEFSFLRTCLLFIGSFDLLASIVCVITGIMLIKAVSFGSFQGRNSSNPLHDERSRLLRKRLTCFWILGSVVFLFRFAMCFSMGTVQWETAVFSFISPLVWQILTLALTEWIPTVLLCILTYSKPSGSLTLVFRGDDKHKVHVSNGSKDEYAYLLIDDENERGNDIPNQNQPSVFERSFVDPGEAG